MGGFQARVLYWGLNIGGRLPFARVDGDPPGARWLGAALFGSEASMKDFRRCRWAQTGASMLFRFRVPSSES